MHKTVLQKEAIDMLDLKTGDVFVDCTFGLGGHSLEVSRKVGPRGVIVGIDADAKTLAKAQDMMSDAKAKVKLFKNNFRFLDEVLIEAGIDKAQAFLFDLGWNSFQFDEGGKGMSFQKNEPLTMTYGDKNEQGFTAEDIVNTWQEENIATIIESYGEERYAKRIAKAICQARLKKPIDTTADLVSIIEASVPRNYERGRINKSTRTFQALRIAVNDELGAIKEALPKALTNLSRGGRIGVISFHSLEDRIVKNIFRDWQKEEIGKVITKKPMTASDQEINLNKRSRSAKLRIFKKND